MIPRACALGIVLSAALARPAIGKTVEVTFDEGTNFAAARSPADGSIVLDLQGTLWRIPAEGGKAVALTDALGDDRLPDVARDGSRIVFQSYRNGTWDIWAIDADGSNGVALTEGPADDREPVLSPDGKQVAFSSDRSGNYDVWVLDLESRGLTKITDHRANDYMPTWSPTGKEIVFVSERDPKGMMGLYRVSVPPEAEPTLVASFESPIASPSFSPDGKLLAVRVLELQETSAGAMGRAASASRLAIVPASGGEPRFLETPDDVFPFRACWASDSEVVYSAAGSVWKQTVRGKQDGGTPVRIPFQVQVTLDRPSYRRRPVEFPQGRERQTVRGLVRPVLAPDNSLIAYTALGDLWVVSTDGGDPVPLTRDEALDSDPHWSPDSRSLVFSSDRGGTMDLWVKDVSASPSSGERQLTSSLGAELTPSWSPDGKTIAYVDEESRLHRIGSDGSDDRVLTERRHAVGIPSWSSDSVHIAMTVHVPISTRFREGYNRILIVNVETGASRLLDQPDRSFGNRDGDGPIWRPDGGALAFAMDGGLWTMPVTPVGEVTGRPRQIVGEPIDFPSWSGDGRRIFFLSSSGLSVVDVASGEVNHVALRHDFETKPAGGRFAIQNVKVIDATGAPAREGMDVFVQGDRIERIDPTGAPIDEGLRVIDGRGKTLIPGLIEMHAHTSLPAYGSRQGKIWLSYGVTSMRTPADALYRVLEERESIEAGRRVGPRVFYTGSTMDGDRIYYAGALAIGDREELHQEMKRALALDYDLVKTYVRLPDALQKEVIDEAHAQGVFVTSHEVYPAVAYGIDGIEHLRGTSRRGYSPKITDLRRSYDDVLELIGRSGVYFTPTVLIHGGWSLALAREPDLLRDSRFLTLFPPFAQDAYRAESGDGDRERSSEVVAPLFKTIAAIHERGGKIVAGTDSAIVPYGLGLILEIEEMSEAGLGPAAAIESATRVAAEALGASHDLGTVEPGKIADLVLLGGDPLEDIRNLRKTEMVVVDGRLLSVAKLLKFH